MSGSVERSDEFDENKIDFELLTLRQRDRATAKASSSSSSSTTTSTTTELDVWPLHLTPRFVEHYITGDVIGSGSYAEVRECVDTITLQRCALKIVDKKYLLRQAPRALANQLQEIRLLRHFNHPNIIKMRECLDKDPFIYIALEYCSFNMQELLNDQVEQRFNVNIGRNFFRQMCSGVSYLHSLGIVHRDIKPQNLLITNSGTLKLIDFGVSHILSMWSRDDLCSNYEGTPLFQSPEVVSGQADYHGFKVDVWSCGITLYLMLYGSYPFMDEAMLGLYDKILGDKFQVPKGPPTSLALTDLLAMMLDKDYRKRATIEETLEHPWLKLNPYSCPQYFCDRDTDGNEQTEFIDRIISRYDDTSHIGSNRQQKQQHHQHQDTSRLLNDAYKSMTVLPYLYRHHFPNLPTTKTKSTSTSSSMSDDQSARAERVNSLSSTSISCRSSASQSSTSTEASSVSDPNLTTPPDSAGSTIDRSTLTTSQSDVSNVSSAISDPNVIIHDDHQQQVEWGTKEQYQLLKTPQIRANRIRHSSARRRRQRQRRRRGIKFTKSR